MIGNPQPSDPRERLAWEILTVADRFRGLSAARLSAPFPPHTSRADAGRHLAQGLADAAAGVAGRGAADPPFVRTIPTIGMFAVGEQVAVTGQDLLTELMELTDDAPVWHGDKRTTVAELILTVADALKQLRVTL